MQAGKVKAMACHPSKTARVAGVTGGIVRTAAETFETPPKAMEVSGKPAPTGACTHETPVTPEIINGGTSAPKVNAGDTATDSRGWLLHYPDRDPLEVACCPEAAHAEILERRPDAVAPKPLTTTIRKASAPLTASEETAIRAWLALIKETDPTTIAEVIVQCKRDVDARDYFTGRAVAELPKPDPFHDDRRTCGQCTNLIFRQCQAAKRGEIVASHNYKPIGDLPRRCEAYLPGADDRDRRRGEERWPGLIQKGDD